MRVSERNFWEHVKALKSQGFQFLVRREGRAVVVRVINPRNMTFSFRFPSWREAEELVRLLASLSP